MGDLRQTDRHPEVILLSVSIRMLSSGVVSLITIDLICPTCSNALLLVGHITRVQPYGLYSLSLTKTNVNDMLSRGRPGALPGKPRNLSPKQVRNTTRAMYIET